MATSAGLSDAGVFLVSADGCADRLQRHRAIATQCALKIAESRRCKWIILGRSTLVDVEPEWARDCYEEKELRRQIIQHLERRGQPVKPAVINRSYQWLQQNREVKETIHRLQALGGEAVYCSADLRHRASLKAHLMPLTRRLGPITGLIHDAGPLDDAPLDAEPSNFVAQASASQGHEHSSTPQLARLGTLLETIAIDQLQYFVLFSSIANFYRDFTQEFNPAPEGSLAIHQAVAQGIAQVEQVSLGVKQRQPNCRVVAVNWSPPHSAALLSPQTTDQCRIDILSVDEVTQKVVEEINHRQAEDSGTSLAQSLATSLAQSPIPVAASVPATQHQVRQQLSLAQNPFVADHRILGKPVLPFTCLLSWTTNVAEQRYPGYQCFSCEAAKLLKGIVFDDSLADEYVLDFQECERSPHEVILDSRIWSRDQHKKLRYHFSSRIRLVRQMPTAPVLETVALHRDGKVLLKGQDFYQRGPKPLFHGPSLQGLQRILNLDESGVVAEYCFPGLTAREQGQFPIRNINPFISDVQLHSIWVWLQHCYDAVCLPTQMGEFQNYRNIPDGQTFYTTVTLVSKTQSRLVIDIAVHDEGGSIYTLIKGAAATVLPLFAAASA